MPHPSLIMFDFDGTLADTCRLGFELMTTAGQRYGFRAPTSYSDYQKLMMMSLPEILWTLKITPWRLKKIIAENMEEGVRLLGTCSLFPDVGNVLRTLSERSRLAIITSNLEKVVENYLHTFGLERYFISILGSETHLEKPQKMVQCLQLVKLQPEQAIFVGDSVRDLKDAHQVGIPTIAVTYGIHTRQMLAKYGPRYWADSAIELQKTIEMLQSSV